MSQKKEMVTVSIRFRKDVWLLFRNTCWEEGLYIREAVEQAFMDFVEKTKKKKEEKGCQKTGLK